MIARLPNGQAIQAYVARPSVPGPGVVVLHSAMFDTLQRQGISATMLTYPGTGHCFFEPSLETYDQPSAVNSWNRTLVFLRENLVRIAPILLLLVVAGCGSPKTAPPAPRAPTPPNLLYQTRDGVRDGLTQWMNEPGAEPEAKLTALFNLKDLRRQGPVQWQAADLDGNGTTEYVLAFPVNNPSSTGDSLGQGAALFVIYRKDGRWEVDHTDPMPDRVENMLMPPSLYAVADLAGTGRPQIISVRPHGIATGPQPFSVFVTAWAPGAFTLLPGQMVISNGPKERMTVTLDGKDVVLTGGSRSHDLMPPRIDRYHFIDGAFKLVDRRFQNPCDFCTLPPKDDFLEGLN